MKNRIKVILIISLALLTLACINPHYEHLRKGDSYADGGKLNEAIAEYTKAIELKPNFVEAYNNRASVYTEMGEYEKAVADCDKILELGLNSPWVHYHRGMAHLEMGNYKLAIDDFTMANNISTDSTFNKMVEQKIKAAESMMDKPKPQ